MLAGRNYTECNNNPIRKSNNLQCDIVVIVPSLCYNDRERDG